MNEVLKSFGIEWKLLIWQVVNFVLLFAILGRFFYKPIRRVLKERERKINDSLEQAAGLEKKSKELEAEFRQKMTEQRKEIELLHSKTLEQGEKLRKEMAAKAESEAQRIIKEADLFAEEEKNRIMTSLESEIKKTAVALAAKILETEIDEKKHKQLIEKTLDEVKKLKTAGRANQ